MPNEVHVIDHPLVQHKLSLMRMKSTSTSAFRNLLGEVSLVVGGTVSATVRARTDCRLRILTRSDFEQRLAQNDLVAYKLLGAVAEVLARRVLRLNDTLVELSAPHAPTPPADDLARFKAKLFSEWSF